MADDEESAFDKAKRQREFDEGITHMTKTFPMIWRRMYEECKSNGFTEDQAMSLVRTYILSQCSGGIRGNDR